ncbi:MAG: T9SS type A sorting domain-containing protein [Flavobacteriales bacterium]
MNRILLIAILTLTAIMPTHLAVSQTEDAAATPLFNPALNINTANYTCIQSFTSTTCLTGSTTQNLGASDSPQTDQSGNGSMSNDIWFAFTAPAEVVKIRVCDPTFDAAFEVWNSTGMSFITGSNQNSTSSTGAAGKEVKCVGGLVYNTVYLIRVGRVSGSGAGTFKLNVEYVSVKVRPSYTPDPPGFSCYTPGNSIKRDNTCNLNVGVGATRWKFVPIPSGTTIICIGTADYSLSSCPGICMGQDYMVYCEVQATDTECGANIWWGYSEGKLIDMCDGACPTITSPSIDTTICNIVNYTFTVSSLGGGEFDYQWRFTTDNGATQFCTPWSTQGQFQPLNSTLANCFRFGKIYQVQVRARYCDNETDPPWCSGGRTVITCNAPTVSVSSGTCCRWRNKNGGTISANSVSGYAQYRFRFTQVDPCSENPLQPLAPACTTAWLNGPYVNPNVLTCIVAGNIYMLQVQGRNLALSCPLCSGSNQTFPQQQSDWGPPCFIGFRTTGSPPVGTPLTCYCTPNMPGEPIDPYADMEEERWNEASEEVVGILSANTTASRIVNVDMAESLLEGNGVMRIFSMNGQVMYEQQVYDVQRNTYVTLNLEQQLAGGIYIISVTTDSGTVSQKIFITKE